MTGGGGGFRDGPPAPNDSRRELTPDMRLDADHAGRFLRLFGSIWMAVGALVAVTFGIVAMIAMQGNAWARLGAFLLAASFFLVGFGTHAIGGWMRRRVLDVFERGTEVRATITAVVLDRRVRMNQRHPWRVHYQYEAEGRVRSGVATFWTDQRPEAEVGDEVSALYVPGSASRSVLWSRLSVATKGSPAATTERRVRVEPSALPVREESSGAPDRELRDELASDSASGTADPAKIAMERDDPDTDAKGSLRGSAE
ncbi:MAG: hypothetical protein U0414_35175 [Polyangiaceae bacterium]